MKKRSRMIAVLMAGAVLMAQPAFAEAVNTVSVDQKLDANYTLALNAITNEEYDLADKYLDICFAYCDPQTDPELYADLLLKRACIDVIEGDTDLALSELDAATTVQPDLADAYLVKTQVYTGLGQYDQAVSSLQSYIDLTQDVSLYETVAQLHEANGDLTAAQEVYQKFLEENDIDEVEGHYQNGIYLMESGQLEEAIAEFEGFTEDEVYGAGALYNIGICKMNSGDYAGARESFDKCLEKGGEFTGVYYNRGVCSLLTEDFETSAADFAKSVETEPYVEDALYNLGISRMQTGDIVGAIQAFTDLIGDDAVIPEVEESSDESGAQQAEGDEGVNVEEAAASDAVAENAAAASGNAAEAVQDAAAEVVSGAAETAEEEDAEGAADGMEETVEETVEETEGTEDSEDTAAETEETEAAEDTAAETDEAAEETAEEAGEESEEPVSDENRVINYSAYYYRAMCYGMIGYLEEALADYTVCIDNGYDLGNSYYQRAQVYEALGDSDSQTADLENSLKYAD